MKHYGNKRAYEELRTTYLSKTEEYKDKIKILEEKIINTHESEQHQEMMFCVDGEAIEDMNINKINSTISYTQNVIISIKKSNKDKTNRQLTKKLTDHFLQLRKLKFRYQELTGNPWTHENCPIIESRVSDLKLKMFIDNIKRDNPVDKIEFDEIVNKRYDNFYEDFKRHSLEMDKSFPLKDEELMFHGTDEKNIASILENDFALINKAAHGTDEKNIASILENDFALINKAAHGTAYGSGIYFTNQLSLACSYSHDQKIKHILVCNVHIGKIISGVSHQTNLPIGYHTAVDNLHNPHQFIKKKNNQYTFIGLLKIHMSSGSKLIRGNLSRFNSTLRVNNHTFHTDIQILFLKNANVIPTGVDFKKYTEDLLTKSFDNKDKTNVQTHFIKLPPAKVKLHTSISCNLNNIYVLGYYNTDIDDINSKVTQEFIIIRIDKIEKNTKIITY